MAYSVFRDLDSWWSSRQSMAMAPVGADLSDVEADLSDVLDDIY
jgi:hypothetical protein